MNGRNAELLRRAEPDQAARLAGDMTGTRP
jgi:hypothetical protein